METLYYNKNDLMRGLVVKRFQEWAEVVIGEPDWLETNGTKSGNDGYFGKDSDTLAKLVQKRLGLVEDGVVGPKTWQAIFDHLKMDPIGGKIYYRDGVKVIDGREFWQPVKKYDGINRVWSGSGIKITGVMLHQTGCWMPEDPQVWNKINAHCGITRKGVIILMFPFEMLIWHGNGLTVPTIGIEIAGLLKGVENSTNTWWPTSSTPDEFTSDQEVASRVLFKIIKEEFDKNGGEWKHVYAHRQSSAMRMSDPGESVWKKVGLEWINDLGATDGGEGYTTGDGYPIPKEWNPAYQKGFWKK